MVLKDLPNILMMLSDSNNQYIQSDWFLMGGYRSAANSMDFAMAHLSYHFLEDASAKWRRIHMLRTE